MEQDMELIVLELFVAMAVAEHELESRQTPH